MKMSEWLEIRDSLITQAEMKMYESRKRMAHGTYMLRSVAGKIRYISDATGFLQTYCDLSSHFLVLQDHARRFSELLDDTDLGQADIFLMVVYEDCDMVTKLHHRLEDLYLDSKQEYN